MSIVLFFVKQKTAYELRISDWSSDVCSSDLFSLVDNFTPVTSVPKGFYLTDAISDHAVDQVRQLGKGKKPFMMYLAYTAAHWPLMAPEETIQKYIPRSEERRGGKECVSTCRSRWAPCHKKKKNKIPI